MQTKTEFMQEAKMEIGEPDFQHMYAVLDNEYYELVEKEIKNGRTISQAVYDSLSDGQKFHFNKHYNHRLDKIQPV